MPNPLPQDPPDRQSRQDSQDPAATRARQRLPADVRNRQILDAALAVFSERGFEAARMDDIAARAGLSKGGLYAHFRSKDESSKRCCVARSARQTSTLPRCGPRRQTCGTLPRLSSTASTTT